MVSITTVNPTITPANVTPTILVSNIIGDTLANGYVELIPKLEPSKILSLSNSGLLQIGYKVFNTTTHEVSSWAGNDWSILSNAVASTLVANTANGQTLVKISNTEPPIAGQALVSTGPTTAIWQTVSGGGSVVVDNYVHVQSTPAVKWTITHNLGKYVPIILMYANGQVFDSDIVYGTDTDPNDLNTIRVFNTHAVAGRAVCGSTVTSGTTSFDFGEII